MCLVAVAWRAHPLYPLLVLGNRDEMHQRPSAPAGWWEDAGKVLGGRDLIAGGGWLAVSKSGRFAVVTNNPARQPGPGTDLSRGKLVADFVTGQQPSGRFLDHVLVNEERYAGFCLLLGTRVQVRGMTSPRSAPPARWTLAPGITVVSNSPLEQPWPKVRYLEDALATTLSREEPPGFNELLALLKRREPVAAGAEDEQELVARLPFIVGPDYGTRASTLVAMDADGRCHFIEERYGPAGTLLGETRISFLLD